MLIFGNVYVICFIKTVSEPESLLKSCILIEGVGCFLFFGGFFWTKPLNDKSLFSEECFPICVYGKFGMRRKGGSV